MASRWAELIFPLAGLQRKFGFQKQPPYSTPDCLNVRPTDVLKGRRRGGSRPGLSKTHYTQLGSGNPIRLLSAVNIVSNNGLTYWADFFDGPSLAPHWVTFSGSNAPGVFPDNAASISFLNTAGVQRSVPSEMDTVSPYVIEAFLVPYNGAFHGDYEIYIAGNTSGAYNTGVVVRLSMQDAAGSYSGALYRYSGGVIQESYLFTAGATGSASPGWFRVLVNGSTISIYWKENLLLTQALSTVTDSYFGFGGECTQAGGACLFDTFRLEYLTNNGSQNDRRLLVASANGVLYKEDYNNTMVAVSSALTLASDRMLQAAERLQKLYIADNGNMKATGTDGVVASGVLDAASMGSNWASVGIDTDDDVVEIVDVVGATGGFTEGVYLISTIHASNGLTLTDVTGSCATCTFRVWRCPKIYDPKAGTLTKWMATAGKGHIPTGCEFVFTFKDKLVLAKTPSAPHAFFQSRSGDPLDWDFFGKDDDPRRAVQGVSVEGGGISAALTAAFAIGDDYAVYSTADSIFVQRGDLTQGARLETVSREIGIVGGKAWCRTQDNAVVFVGRDGLYAMPPGGGVPVALSREFLPEELQRLDSQLYFVQLNYDVQACGIHVIVTAKETTGQNHYFFDWKDKSFWPFSLAAIHEPTASFSYSGTISEDCAVIFGCRDGYLRRFRNEAERDDDTAFSSYVNIGPLMIGNGTQNGMLAELEAMVAYLSGDVSWSVYSGESAEEAVLSSTAFESGTWTEEGISYREHVRLSNQAAIIKISNGQTGRAWAIEHLRARIEAQGRVRK